MREPMPGYWGPTTATVDWCEANYRYTPYVCELFNTVSSLVIVAAGGLGAWLHRRILEVRFVLAFGAVAVVGLGSIAFHATLRFELQMLDELPMVYSGLVMFFILIENRPERRFGLWFPLALMVHAVLVSVLCSQTRGGIEFALFHVSFGSLEAFALSRAYLIYRRSSDAVLRGLYRFGMGSYALALIAWLSDLAACPLLSITLPSLGIPNPQLHAVWHVLVSCGMYLLTLVIALDRLAALGRPNEVVWTGGWLPQITVPARPLAHLVATRAS